MFLKELFSTKVKWNRKKYWVSIIGTHLVIIGVFASAIMPSMTSSWQKYQKLKELSVEAKEIRELGIDVEEKMQELNVESIKISIESNKNNQPMLPMFMYNILWFILWYIIFAIYIKRLNDISKSKWYSLLAFIPIINIFFMFWCWVKKTKNI